MERKIELKLINPEYYWMKGIYLIRIGRLKYIGKALVIGDRINQHRQEINRTIANYSEIVNIKDEWKRLGSYIKLAQYLHENPKINEGTVEVLERQVCSKTMYHSENFYLKELVGNSDYYNSSYSGSKPRHDEDHLWEVVENNGQLEYFDPRINHLKVLSTNIPARNKEVIKQSKPYKMQRLAEVRERLLGTNPSLEMRKAVIEYTMREISKM